MAFAVENVSDGFDASVPVTPPLNIIAGFDAVKRGPGARIRDICEPRRRSSFIDTSPTFCSVSRDSCYLSWCIAAGNLKSVSGTDGPRFSQRPTAYFTTSETFDKAMFNSGAFDAEIFPRPGWIGAEPQREERDITTSRAAPIFRAPSKTPYKACGPKGSTGRPSTRHSRDESRAAQSETSARTAQHGTGSRDGKCRNSGVRTDRKEQDSARNQYQQNGHRQNRDGRYRQQERSVVLKKHVASIGPHQDTLRTRSG